MKSLITKKLKLDRIAAIPLVLLASIAFTLALALPNVRAQQAQLSLADLLIGLRSNKVTLVERNRLLAGAVEDRGITFALTPEIEKELESTGADLELIKAIKRKSEIQKPTTTIQQKLIPAVVSPTPAPVEPDSSFYKKQADENASKGENEAAVANYGKAIELNPKNPAIYLNRALVQIKLKNFESAISDYDKVIELNPGELTAYANRANSFEKLGKVENAVTDYKKILELDDKNESALNNLKRIEDDRARELQKAKEAAAALAQAEAAKEKPKEDPKPKVEEQVPVTPPTNLITSDVVDIGRIGPSMAIRMVSPTYSQIAKNLNLTGQVTVQVTIDEEGNVTTATTKEGHRLLRESAEQAAKRSKIIPAQMNGKAVKSKGFIVYSFVR